MGPEVAEDRGGRVVGGDFAVDLAEVEAVVEVMGIGSITGAGNAAEAEEAGESIVPDALGVDNANAVLTAGGGVVAGVDELWLVKKNTSPQTTRPTARLIATTADRFRGGGWV